MQASGARADLARRLGAAEQQHAHRRELTSIQVQLVLETLAVLRDAAVLDRPEQPLPIERQERPPHRALVVGRHRRAIGGLVAGVHEPVERERIVLGRGDLLFDQGADDADLDRIEAWFHGVLRAGRGSTPAAARNTRTCPHGRQAPLRSRPARTGKPPGGHFAPGPEAVVPRRAASVATGSTHRP